MESVGLETWILIRPLVEKVCRAYPIAPFIFITILAIIYMSVYIFLALECKLYEGRVLMI